jgi:hypothetical protein
MFSAVVQTVLLMPSELFLYAVRKPKIESGRHNHACDCWELVDLYSYICATDCTDTVCMVDLGSDASPWTTASSVSTGDMVFVPQPSDDFLPSSPENFDRETAITLLIECSLRP